MLAWEMLCNPHQDLCNACVFVHLYQYGWFCMKACNIAKEFNHVRFINNKLWLFFFGYSRERLKSEFAWWRTLYQPLELILELKYLCFIIYFDDIRRFNKLHFFHLCFRDATTLWIRVWFFHLYFVDVPSHLLWNNCKVYLLECVVCLRSYIGASQFWKVKP